MADRTPPPEVLKALAEASRELGLVVDASGAVVWCDVSAARLGLSASGSLLEVREVDPSRQPVLVVEDDRSTVFLGDVKRAPRTAELRSAGIASGRDVATGDVLVRRGEP